MNKILNLALYPFIILAILITFMPLILIGGISVVADKLFKVVDNVLEWLIECKWRFREGSKLWRTSR